MRNFIYKTALLAALCMMSTTGLSAQDQPKRFAAGRSEVAFGFDAARANVVPGQTFWTQGGDLQAHVKMWHKLGLAADGSELHTADINHSSVGLDLVIVSLGPRYTWRPSHGRYALFGQGLAGYAYGFNSTFPHMPKAESNANSLSVQAGGGFDVSMNRSFALRAFEASWLRTELPNAATNTQNSLEIGAGIVFRFR